MITQTDSSIASLNITRDDLVVQSSASPSGYESLSRAAALDKFSNSSDIIAPFFYSNGFIFADGLGLVLNESLLIADSSTPNLRFPFGRLAWLTSNTSSLYIYHQINESALAEEEDINGAGWITRLIPVSTG